MADLTEVTDQLRRLGRHFEGLRRQLSRKDEARQLLADYAELLAPYPKNVLDAAAAHTITHEIRFTLAQFMTHVRRFATEQQNWDRQQSSEAAEDGHEGLSAEEAAPYARLAKILLAEKYGLSVSPPATELEKALLLVKKEHPPGWWEGLSEADRALLLG